MKRKKISNLSIVNVLLVIAIVVVLVVVLTGCVEDQASTVSYNLKQEADNFNVVRRLTVINGITNDTELIMEGKMSINADAYDNQLEVTVEESDGYYSIHYVGLGDNTTYIVEQLNVKNVDNYNYTMNLNPKMWWPVKAGIVD